MNTEATENRPGPPRIDATGESDQRVPETAQGDVGPQLTPMIGSTAWVKLIDTLPATDAFTIRLDGHGCPGRTDAP